MPARRRHRERSRRLDAIELLLDSTDPSHRLTWPPDSYDGVGWLISSHARERARQRSLSLGCLLDAATKARVSYPANDNSGRVIRQLGAVAVVVQPATRTVITVLLTGPDRWTDEQARAAFAKQPRPAVSLRNDLARLGAGT